MRYSCFIMLLIIIQFNKFEAKRNDLKQFEHLSSTSNISSRNMIELEVTRMSYHIKTPISHKMYA